MDSKDETYHLRCLQLALNGIGRVAPNPMVGAVLVANNEIIGEGFHNSFGGPHAEVNAINSVKDSSLLSKATLFVNLEPCSHFGKTPPCADLIIEKKIPRVVIGHHDPFPNVSGNGIQKLKNAGIEIVTNTIFTKKSRFINRRFFTFHEKKRPYIILKWAETADGFIDVIRKGDCLQAPNWITDEQTRVLVHKWRTEEQAILIGTNTALLDNPKLNARDFSGKNPTRIILDQHLRLSVDLKVFDQSIPTIILTSKEAQNRKNLEFITIDFSSLLDCIFDLCNKRQIISIIVEGGAQLLNTFITQNLWDEARVFVGDMSFGNGIKASELSILPSTEERLSNSLLKIWYNREY
jgi:diaminohydroxyphosphoribosylaminopyrimidine deaminase / 5-amino-6-(5-phosphoribosylamino)uracil reductase